MLVEAVAKRYFHQILSGLRHIHSECVVHRDLKPTNILVDANDHIKVADFSKARKVINYEHQQFFNYNSMQKYQITLKNQSFADCTFSRSYPCIQGNTHYATQYITLNAHIPS